MTTFVQRLESLAIVAFSNAVGFASLFWLWSAFPPFLLYNLVDDELLGLYIVNEKWPLKVDRPDSCENINFHGWQVKLFEKASFLYMFCALCLLAQYIKYWRNICIVFTFYRLLFNVYYLIFYFFQLTFDCLLFVFLLFLNC